MNLLSPYPITIAITGAVVWALTYTYFRAYRRYLHAECPYKCLTLLNHNAVLRRQLEEAQYLNTLSRNREMELQAKIFEYEQQLAAFPEYAEFAEIEEAAA